jgi:arylformamidase
MSKNPGQAIYLDYDRAGLDAQYNLREAQPSFQSHFDRWRAASERTRRVLPGQLDLAYGPGAMEKLDLFTTTRKAAPIHMFIHGGYWQAMDKSDFSFIASGLAPKGAHVAIVNYSLAPSVNMDEIVRQARAATIWLWRNASRFGGDPNRLFVSGHSAGAHLAAMLLLAPWSMIESDLAPDMVKGGAAISGVFDLAPIRLCYVNDVVGLDDEMAERNSPIRILEQFAPQARPDLILCLGENETDEFQRQQQEFARVWTGRKLRLTIVPAARRHHFNVVDGLADSGNMLNRSMLKLMGL